MKSQQPASPRVADAAITGFDTGTLWGQKTAGMEVPYHNGPVLQSSRTYPIYWGDPSAFPSDLVAGMDDFFTGFGNSSYSSLLNQYLPTAATSSYYGANVFDTTEAPTRALSRGSVAHEVCKFIKTGDLPLDPIDRVNNTGGVYFVFTSTFPSNRVNFCAWHSYATCEGKPIAIAYVPNVSATNLCNPGDLYDSTTYTYGTRIYGTVVAHELAESITDPKLSAWHGPHINEIGDLCAWQFSAPVTLSTGTTWQLQEEWSDLGNGCAQQGS
ncbi:MAG TPA: hypothetical protein VMT61_01400 [Candidatus Binataceae bacterium]|nr:hypothetical protein [Candidatus Binataceae bacterium]